MNKCEKIMVERMTFTARRGKILGLGILSELKFRGRNKAYPMTVEIYDRNTRIKVWEKELN